MREKSAWLLSFNKKYDLERWSNSFDMKYYQNQLNVATYNATQRCGISIPLINHKNNLLRSIIRFHIYYQIRKCLNELKIALPG